MSEETKATLLVLSDFPPKQVDVIFFFARAKGDDNEAIFNIASELYHDNMAKTVLINGSDGNDANGKGPKAWAGKEEWSEKLAELKVKHVESFAPAWNTMDEAHKMVTYAKEKDWKSGVILAQPHQLLRCLASLISAMKKNAWDMEIYSAAPRECDWFEETYGSQGKNLMQRYEHIKEEYERIKKYSALGHIATVEEVLEYFKSRNSKD